MTNELELREQLQATAVTLQRKFAGMFSTETIERLLHDSLDRLQRGARYSGYVPIFAERFTHEGCSCTQPPGPKEPRCPTARP